VRKIIGQDKKILFVATKKQLRDTIKDEALTCNMPYVVERWVGGLLTNFSTIRERVKRYSLLLEKRKNGEFEAMPRKEVTRLRRELERMDKIYSGITSLGDLPACIYIVDPKKEIACVREANRLSIPIVGLIDTDADPDVIDWPVPGNDDAIKSVRYITSALTEAIKEEQKKTAQILKKKEEEAEKATEGKKEEPDVEKYEVLDEETIKEKETKAAPKKRSPRKEV